MSSRRKLSRALGARRRLSAGRTCLRSEILRHRAAAAALEEQAVLDEVAQAVAARAILQLAEEAPEEIFPEDPDALREETARSRALVQRIRRERLRDGREAAVEKERAWLGAVMTVSEPVRRRAWFHEGGALLVISHAQILDAIVNATLLRCSSVVTVDAVCRELALAGNLDAVGGKPYVAALFSAPLVAGEVPRLEQTYGTPNQKS